MNSEASFNNVNLFLSYRIGDDYQLTFVSESLLSLLGGSFDKINASKCFSYLFNRSTPCEGCVLYNSYSQVDILHRLTLSNMDKICLKSRIIKSDEGYLAILLDVTEYIESLDKYRYELKKIKASYISEKINEKKGHNNRDFISKLMDKLSVGILVANSNYEVLMINESIRGHLEAKPHYCYSVYGFDRPCDDCPYTHKSVVKSSRNINNKNLTIEFVHLDGYIVESIRDTTKEVALINKIKVFNDEIQEKQRQMILLNKDLVKMNNKLKIVQGVIDEELAQVGRLQRSLLPDALPVIDGFEFASFYMPAEHAGGDYYDCIKMSNDYWGFTVADVSGHGAPATVIMAMARAIMRSYTYDVISPSEALYMVNEILCDNVYTNDFVTMFYVVLNTIDSKLFYSSAGHNPILFFDKSEMLVHMLTTDGFFLATFPNIQYNEKELAMDSGDILFMYTDGLIEAMNSSREQYGIDSVISRIIMYSHEGCQRIIDEIMGDVKDFTKGLPFEDDVTILVIMKK